MTDEDELRRWIGCVRAGSLGAARFPGATRRARRRRAGGQPAAGGCRHRPADLHLQADATRRRRHAEAAVLAGADAAEPAFRQQHQGCGRIAPLLRVAGAIRCRRSASSDSCGRDPEQRQRRHRRGRSFDHVEVEARRHLARRQAVHRGRRHLQLALCDRPGDRGVYRRRLRKRQGHREDRHPRGAHRLREAVAGLDTHLQSAADSATSVRTLPRREVA